MLHWPAAGQDYEATIAALPGELDRNNYETVVEIAALLERTRGYGHVKVANVARAKQHEAQLIASLRSKAAA